MRIPIILILLIFLAEAKAQEIADFENFEIGLDTFLNGSDLSGGFISGNVILPNSYNPDFMSWTDWSISTMRDDSTAGFQNQYSAYAGGGAQGSDTYAVSSAFSPVKIKIENNFDGLLNSVCICNSTYSALSMLNGDMFAKAFGGESGNDPDFLLLTIKGWFRGEPLADSINFYLADYRFEDNSQDYIVKDWEFLDLSPLFAIDSLEFSLTSSDNGMFGMNTPAFFCVDNIDITNAIINTKEGTEEEYKIYPNPAANFIIIEALKEEDAYCSIFNQDGKMVSRNRILNGRVNIQSLSAGIYLLKTKIQGKSKIQKFVKL